MNRARYSRSNFAFLLCAALLAQLGLITLAAVAQPEQPVLVADLNQKNNGAKFDIPQSAQVVGGYFFFSAEKDANDQTNDYELWKSNGTPAGTALVKNINPSGGSFPYNLLAVGDILYFTANNGTSGTELWKSDGTEAGTVLLRDIKTGPNGGSPYALTAIGNTLYFAADDGISGVELWKSDGTQAGTVRITDINTGGNSEPLYLTEFQGNLIFAADDGTGGSELWKFDTTSESVSKLKEVNPSGPASVQNLLVVGSTLFFVANDGTHGLELWKTDGTTANTELVKDILSGTASGFPHELTAVGSTLFFSAYSTSNTVHLWKSDGTTSGTVPVTTINRSSGSGINPTQLTAVGSLLYFYVFEDGDRLHLWKSDGTPQTDPNSGTKRVKAINPSGSSDPDQLTAVGDKLMFTANDGTLGTALWISDGSEAGTILVRDILPGTIGEQNALTNFFEFDGQLIFTAPDGNVGYELWKSNGTLAGTQKVVDINTITLDGLDSEEGPANIAFDGHIYFTANSDNHGYELWRIDETTGTAELFEDIAPGAYGSYPLSSSPHNFSQFGDSFVFVTYDADDYLELRMSDGGQSQLIQGGFYDLKKGLAVGDTFYFAADDGTNGLELWKTDGTTAELVDDINPQGDSDPRNLTVFQGKLYFSADDGTGRELWKSDGTAAGTLMVQDLVPNGESLPNNLTVLGNSLFFVADGQSGSMLWKTDGNTIELVNIGQAGASSPSGLTVLGSEIFFSADGLDGSELWKTNGTNTSAVRAGAGDPLGYPSARKVLGSKLLIVADDGTSGNELWVTDGVTTELVKDINPTGSSLPRQLTTLGDQMYFVANDGSTGKELWVTDGTTSGTMQVADLFPGPNGSIPLSLVAGQSALYFAANDGQHGFEWWRLGGLTSSSNQSGGSPSVSGSLPSFSGPIITELSPRQFSAGLGRTVVMKGSRLQLVTELRIGSTILGFTRSADGSLLVNLPALAAGIYDLQVSYGTSLVTHQSAIRVEGTLAALKNLRFGNFLGNQSTLTRAARLGITKALVAQTDVSKVTCTGSTSGRVASASDRRLALRRAQAACSLVSRLRPDVATELRTRPASGVGAQFRSVSLEFEQN